MLSNQNTNIDILLAKHFTKEQLSPTEKEQVKKWKQRNQQEYVRLKKLISKERKPIIVDTEKAWRTLLEKKQKKVEQKNIGNFLPNKFIFYGVAASLTLLLGTWVWFYLSKSPYEEYYNDKFFVTTYTLPDNSTVNLNHNARLRYYKNEKKIRKVELLSGEVFFEVQPNKQQPFTIITPNALVKVLGTSFNVKTNSKNTEVSVKSGVVSLSNHKKESLNLTQGEQGSVDSNGLTKTKMDNENYLAWKTRKLVFKNTSLYDAAKKLEDYYYIKIDITKNCENFFFTTTFTTETLEEAMKEIQFLTHIDYEIKENKVVISCVNCE